MTHSIIRNGTLIDGTGGMPLPSAGVLIREERIQEVGPVGSLRLPDDSIQEIVEREDPAPGGTNGAGGPRRVRQEKPEATANRVAENRP